MLPTDRVVLIDLENLVGANRRPPTLRARVTALLEAAGSRHHAVAAYAAPDADSDTAASVLAALGVAPLRVQAGPNAAENALIRHAVRMQADGCTRFTVCSGDRAFATLADAENTRIDVPVWQGQPVAARLAEVGRSVSELPRPDKPTAAGTAWSARAASPPGPVSIPHVTAATMGVPHPPGTRPPEPQPTPTRRRSPTPSFRPR